MPINLSQFYEGFRAESADSPQEFENVPDGKYHVTIEKLELTESRTSHSPMLKWTFRIIAPRFLNRLLWRNSVINHNTLKHLKADLHVCGLDLRNLSDLPNRLESLLDTKLEITKKTSGDYENIYVNARIDAPAVGASPRRSGGDRVPF